MPKLTDVLLRKTPRPSKGRTQIWDTKTTGLVFRITAAGAKTWSVYYRFEGAQRRLTLGPYRPEDSAEDGLTLTDARAKARDALRDVADGRDPHGEKLQARREAGRAGSTLADIAEKWLKHGRSTKGERRGKPWRAKTKAEFARLVNEEIIPVLGDLDPGDVTKAHIRALYDKIEKRSESVAQHTLAVLRLFYQWASEDDHVDAVPVFPKRGTQTARRERILEPAELRAVWGAIEAGIGKDTKKPDAVDVMAEAFRLLLLTGQRRGEVLSMRWQDITEEKDGAWWTIPPERSKGGRAQRVPLATAAVESLKRLRSVQTSETWIFPAPKAEALVPFVGNPQKAAERLWAKSAVKGAHVHDLRRSMASNLARLGVPRLVVGKVLGHADGEVTGRYDVHGYDREKRAALTKWAGELRRIVAAKEDDTQKKVLPWAR